MKKYEIVADWIKSRIASGELADGDKLPSEAELMRQFDVSRNVVRQSANEMIKEGLIQSKQGVGYFVQKIKSNESTDIGFICFRSSSYIFPEILHGANKVIQKNGYHMMFHESWYDINVERDLLVNMLQKGVRGMILTPVQGPDDYNNADIVQRFEKAGIPVVLMDSFFPGQEFCSVSLSDEKSGYAAAKYLYDNGHRRIGMIYSKNYYPKVVRAEGVKALLKDMNCPADESLFVGIEGQGPIRKTFRQINEAIESMNPLPTAIVCSSDDEAIILISQLKRLGYKVPDDVSIISFDNSDISRHSSPSLTTMNHPSEYMGEMAATMLINRINNPQIKINTHTYIDSQIIKRDSVKRIELG